MTAIAAVTDGKRVWIGGDSAGVAGYHLQVRADQKVFENGPMIFGFTSSFRMGQVLRHALTIPHFHPDDDIEKWMSTAFVDAVRAVLKEKGFATVSNGVETGGTFLVGFKGRLFEIEDDFQVGFNDDGFAAVGSGIDLSLGALSVATGTPEARIITALTAAERFSAGVRRPFVVKSGGKA